MTFVVYFAKKIVLLIELNFFNTKTTLTNGIEFVMVFTTVKWVSPCGFYDKNTFVKEIYRQNPVKSPDIKTLW